VLGGDLANRINNFDRPKVISRPDIQAFATESGAERESSRESREARNRAECVGVQKHETQVKHKQNEFPQKKASTVHEWHQHIDSNDEFKSRKEHKNPRERKEMRNCKNNKCCNPRMSGTSQNVEKVRAWLRNCWLIPTVRGKNSP
jgi:hypothetical protein